MIVSFFRQMHPKNVAKRYSYGILLVPNWFYRSTNNNIGAEAMAVNTWQRQIKAAIGGDYVRAKADGSVEYRRGYYYRPCKLEEWKAQLEKLFADDGIKAVVSVNDHWHRDPSRSYFRAIITQPGSEGSR